MNKGGNKEIEEKGSIELILEHYNELKKGLKYFIDNNLDSDWLEGQLCATRYILINVYGFRDSDKRF